MRLNLDEGKKLNEEEEESFKDLLENESYAEQTIQERFV